MLARDGNKAAQYFIDDEVQLGNEYVLTFLDQNGINECYKKNAGIRYALTKFKQSRHAQNVISRDDIRACRQTYLLHITANTRLSIA